MASTETLGNALVCSLHPRFSLSTCFLSGQLGRQHPEKEKGCHRRKEKPTMKRKRNKATGPHKGSKDKSGSVFNWRDTDDIQREHERRPGHAAWLLSTLGSHPTPSRTTKARACPSPRDTHWQIQTGQHPERSPERLGRQTKEITTQETLLYSHPPPFFWVRVAQIPFQSHRLWAGGTMTIHVSTGLSP